MPPIPRLSWSDFLATFRWKQGEHITLIGPTGRGKTTLALELLPFREHVLVFANKRRDRTMSALLKKDGFRRAKKWPDGYGKRFVLWPDLMEERDLIRQRDTFLAALGSAFRQGAWCVYLDEILYHTKYLGLEKHVNLLWQQGRSIGVSVVGGTQRPTFIPLYAYDQATHLFLWRDNDERNIKRVLQMVGNLDVRAVRDAYETLGRFETLYIDTREGTMIRTQVGR